MVFGITCIRIVILICVCIKKNVITLELLENSWLDIFDEYWFKGPRGHFYSDMGLAMPDV